MQHKFSTDSLLLVCVISAKISVFSRSQEQARLPAKLGKGLALFFCLGDGGGFGCDRRRGIILE